LNSYFATDTIKYVNNTAWRRAIRKLGIKGFRWHDLRHTWASWQVQAGTPLGVLQELGGWESFEMVRRYAHFAPEHLADAAQKIDTKLATVVGPSTSPSQPGQLHPIDRKG
jgi:integrase